MKKPRHLMPDDGVYCAGATVSGSETSFRMSHKIVPV